MGTIKNLSYIVTANTNPYENLALEKYLLENVKPDEIILYLWQNAKTVVCGRNQNIWKECKVDELIKDGGYPTRRLSGGGAVFHDLGNLNFTFLVSKENFNVNKQLSVLAKACEMLGIKVKKTGRNDVVAFLPKENKGRKFSGNAFHELPGAKTNDGVARKCHHGTIMIDVDSSLLEKYLNVDKEKFESKGVDSVSSRVCNLKQIKKNITVEKMKDAMIKAFEEVYKHSATKIDDIDKSLYKFDADYFKSDSWLYENNIKFDYRVHKRYDWGDFDLRVKVDKGIISDIVLCSDAMDENYILELNQKYKGLIGTEFKNDLLQ